MSDTFEDHDDHWDPGLVSRRGMLTMIGGMAGILGLGHCSGGGGGTVAVAATASSTTSAIATATATATATAAATGTTTASTCVQTPEGEIGPYFTDDSTAGYERSNILSNLDGTSTQTGVPFTLTLYIYDYENACKAYGGAQVDIWHCNASGIYSNESSENSLGSTWLRGYQLSDSTGKVTFTTIVPGWYGGRTTHIHVRVRSTYSSALSTSDGTNTTQLFFPQALVNMLATSVSPYSAEGTNSTTNASDHVYSPETKGETLLSVVGSTTAGYSATYAVGLPIGG